MSLCVRPQWDYMIFGCRCGSLLVDFEVFTPEEDEDDSVIMDKMSEAVKSNSIDGFSVSADSYSFTRMPSRLRKKCICFSEPLSHTASSWVCSFASKSFSCANVLDGMFS